MGVIGGVIASNSSGGSVDLSTTVILAPTSSSRNTIQATTTGIVPLTLKLYTGSTANLLECKNAAGTTITSINSDGGIDFTGNWTIGVYPWILRYYNNIGTLTGYFNFGRYSFGTVFTVSQAMNWSSDAFNVAADVGVERTAAGILKFTNASSGYGSLILGAYSASTVGLTVKGAASQSANLTEWQNSSGVALSLINSSGDIVGLSKIIARQSGGVAGTDEIQISHSGTAGLIENKDGDLAICTSPGQATGTTITLLSSGGGVYIRGHSNINKHLFNQAEYRLSYDVSIGFCSNSTVTSAAADINLTRSAAGILQLKNGSSGNGSLICGAYSASTVALTVKAAASQTANIQEWQNSSGTALAYIAPGVIFGSYDATYLAFKPSLRSYRIGTQDAGGQFCFSRSDGSYAFLLAPGYTTYGVLLGASIGGQLHFVGSTTNEAMTLNPGEGAAVVAIGKRATDGSSGVGCMTEFWPRSGQTNPVITTLVPGGATQVFKVKINGDIYTTLQSASVVGLTIKGYTSQTANLQEWQNSSGTVIAKVTSNGTINSTTNFGCDLYSDFYSNRAYLWMNYSATRAALFEGLQTDRTTLTVRPAASQTTNIQAWESSGGTVLSRVDKNGTLVTKVNSAPADGDLAANECSWYFDSTNGSAFVRFKGKTADGTVVTGSLALT